MEDYEAYFAHARILTKIYALPKISKPSAEVRKQPLQVSNFNIDTDLPILPLRSTVESVSSPESYRSSIPLLVDVDFSASPMHCATPGGKSCRSPFVGSPVKAKRFKSSMRRL